MSQRADDPILRTDGVNARAVTGEGYLHLLDDFSIMVSPGQILGLVGESGSGKTTAVRTLIGLLAPNVTTHGEISLSGRSVFSSQEQRDGRASVRGSEVGMIFQSASASLNPVMRVGTQLREVTRRHRPNLSKAEAHQMVLGTLSEMGFAAPDKIVRAYPHQLSGGMQQRAAIALAVVGDPRLIIADECTSALDVTTQAEVVRLLARTVRERECAMIFVTHDLLLAADLCTEVAVMYAGQIVESGPTQTVLAGPAHPYTDGLIQAIPTWNITTPLRGIEGTAPQVTDDSVGCRFAPRCAHARGVCTSAHVPWVSLRRGRQIALCHGLDQKNGWLTLDDGRGSSTATTTTKGLR